MVQTQPELNSQPIWSAVIRLLRWDKPAGRLILMIPALWAVFLAGRGMPPPLLVGIIVIGSLATSAAGCVVNDLWDRNIDPYVERTRNRPLASRALSVKVGLIVALIAFTCAWGLVLYLNPLSFWLSVVAVPVIVLYPLAKRVFPIPQLIMAIAWGFAVLISWSAVVARLEPTTWTLWGATVLWALGFDTVYAMADREDDQRIGVHSSARFFGQHAAHAVSACFASTALLFAGLGSALHLHTAFWLTLGVSSLFWGWQSWQLHQKNLPSATYGQIFRQNVGVGFLLLAGLVAGYLL